MSATAAEIAARLEFARTIAREAGSSTLDHFTPDVQVERKSDNSPVTIADRQAEELMRDRIAQQFADDGVLGEEYGEATGNSGFRWILDPIDGTKSFIHGVPLYTTLVGVEYDQRSIVGVIYAPALDELICASTGQGAWYSKTGQPPVRARVSQTDNLAESLLLTSEVGSFTRHRTPDAMATYLELDRRCRLARTWGDAYGYMMVATGRAEVMIDPAMSLWDAAALQPILEEAGGTFTDWHGTATIHSGEGLGTNGRVLDEVLAAIRESAG